MLSTRIRSLWLRIVIWTKPRKTFRHWELTKILKSWATMTPRPLNLTSDRLSLESRTRKEKGWIERQFLRPKSTIRHSRSWVTITSLTSKSSEKEHSRSLSTFLSRSYFCTRAWSWWLKERISKPSSTSKSVLTLAKSLTHVFVLNAPTSFVEFFWLKVAHPI